MARARPEQQRSIASVVFILMTTIFKIVVSSADLKKRRCLVYSSARRVWEPFFSSKGGTLIKQTKQRLSTQRGNVCEVTFRKGLELFFSLPLQLRKVRLQPGSGACASCEWNRPWVPKPLGLPWKKATPRSPPVHASQVLPAQWPIRTLTENNQPQKTDDNATNSDDRKGFGKSHCKCDKYTNTEGKRTLLRPFLSPTSSSTIAPIATEKQHGVC